MRNKISQLEDFLPYLATVVILLFVFMIISFLNFRSDSEAREDVKLKFTEQEATELLLKFLDSSFDETRYPKTTVADAIGINFGTGNKEFETQLQAKSREFFSRTRLESYPSTWSLEITENEDYLAINSDYAQHLITKKEISKIIVPGYSGGLIEVKLSIITFSIDPAKRLDRAFIANKVG